MRIGLLLLLLAVPCLAQSIEGCVRDAATGQPVPGARVVAGQGGRKELETDTAGSYGVTGLKAGHCDLWVTADGYENGQFLFGRQSNRRTLTLSAGEELKGVDFLLRKPGIVTGRVLDADNQPVPAARVKAFTALGAPANRLLLPAGPSVQTDDRGDYRLYDLPGGRVYLQVTVPRRFGAKARTWFLPAYYPGVEELSAAVPVTVFAARETNGIDVRLQKAEIFTITGKTAPNAGVWLDPGGERALAGSNGEFAFPVVRAGAWRITAYSPSGEAGTVDVTIRDRNPDPLVIAVAAGPDVQGAVRFDDEIVRSGLQVTLSPQRQDLGIPRPAPGPVDAKGRFAIPAVTPGTYNVSVSGLPENCYLIDPKPYTPGPELIVRISTKGGAIQATVRDSEDNPAGQAFVLLDVDGRRQFEIADQHGVVRFAGLAPGSYKLYAFEAGDISALHDADLRRFSASTAELNERAQLRTSLPLLAARP